MAVIGDKERAQAQMTVARYARDFGGAPASTAPRVVPRVEGVVRGAGPASATREAPPAQPPTTYKPSPAVTVVGHDVTVVGHDVTAPSHTTPPAVTGGSHMSFGEAVDALGVGQDELAACMGVSSSAIRTARLRPDSPSHRAPPKGWRQAIARLARERADHLQALAAEMERD